MAPQTHPGWSNSNLKRHVNHLRYHTTDHHSHHNIIMQNQQSTIKDSRTNTNSMLYLTKSFKRYPKAILSFYIYLMKTLIK